MHHAMHNATTAMQELDLTTTRQKVKLASGRRYHITSIHEENIIHTKRYLLGRDLMTTSNFHSPPPHSSAKTVKPFLSLVVCRHSDVRD